MDLIDSIFDGGTWRGYQLSWCEHCHHFIITHDKCQNSTCTGGSCKECERDFKDFNTQVADHVQSYLSNKEDAIFDKIHRIKNLMIQSISAGEKRIDWQRLKQEGKLSRNDFIMFRDFIK